jgi:hypothetical protein
VLRRNSAVVGSTTFPLGRLNSKMSRSRRLPAPRGLRPRVWPPRTLKSAGPPWDVVFYFSLVAPAPLLRGRGLCAQNSDPSTVGFNLSTNNFLRACTMMKLGIRNLPKWPVPCFLPICKPMKPRLRSASTPMGQSRLATHGLSLPRMAGESGPSMS